jgi:hypothetical protein
MVRRGGTALPSLLETEGQISVIVVHPTCICTTHPPSFRIVPRLANGAKHVQWPVSDDAPSAEKRT